MRAGLTVLVALAVLGGIATTSLAQGEPSSPSTRPEDGNEPSQPENETSNSTSDDNGTTAAGQGNGSAEKPQPTEDNETQNDTSLDDRNGTGTNDASTNSSSGDPKQAGGDRFTAVRQEPSSTNDGATGDRDQSNVGQKEESKPRAARALVVPLPDALPRVDLTEKEQTAVAASAGAALGVGLLAYYWASVKLWLLGSLAGPLFSRINKKKVLENRVRNHVFETVEANPGITLTEVVSTCRLGWGTTVYHLNRLETERLIISDSHRRRRRFFKNGHVVNGDKRAVSELRNPTTAMLARAVEAAPGSAQLSLCQRVGVSPPLAHKHLKRLLAADLIVSERDNRFVRYRPTERLGRLAEFAALPDEATSSLASVPARPFGAPRPTA